MKRALVSAAVTAAAVTLSSTPAWAAPAGTSSDGAQTASPAGAAVTYQVVPGDSFWAIGKRFGVSMSDLAAYNHLDLWSPLDAGWTLRIPPAGWHASGPTGAAPTSNWSGHRTYTSSASPARSAAPGGVWACIAAHESGGNPATNTGNGYYGMYQFSLSTWQAAGGTGNPAYASAAEQTAVAQRVQQQQGWGAWPVTSAECGA